MTINIDNLKEPELIDLNNRIVARLKFLREMRAHKSMLEFSKVSGFLSNPMVTASCTGSSPSTTGNPLP